MNAFSMEADILSIQKRTMDVIDAQRQSIPQSPQVNEREVVDAVWGLIHAPSMAAYRVGEKMADSPSWFVGLAGVGLISWAVFAGLSRLDEILGN
jgi:hypothetical protein